MMHVTRYVLSQLRGNLFDTHRADTTVGHATSKQAKDADAKHATPAAVATLTDGVVVIKIVVIIDIVVVIILRSPTPLFATSVAFLLLGATSPARVLRP